MCTYLPSHRLINCAFIIAVASWSALSRILRKESEKWRKINPINFLEKHSLDVQVTYNHITSKKTYVPSTKSHIIISVPFNFTFRFHLPMLTVDCEIFVQHIPSTLYKRFLVVDYNTGLSLLFEVSEEAKK